MLLMLDHGRTRMRLCHQVIDKQTLDEQPRAAHLARRHLAAPCPPLQRLAMDLQQRRGFRQIESAHRAQPYADANIDAKLPGAAESSRSGLDAT